MIILIWQVRHIRTLLKEAFDEATARLIDVNSVDGFQGREKDIIVLSTVRSDLGQREKRGIGFLRDARRMNVSITRARSSVFVLGHADTLAKDPLWEAALQDATDRHCLVKALKPIGPWFEAARKEPERSAPDELDADHAGADGEATAEAASTVVVQRAPEVDTGAVSSPRGARAKRAAKSGRG
jgi:senataxin